MKQMSWIGEITEIPMEIPLKTTQSFHHHPEKTDAIQGWYFLGMFQWVVSNG